MIQRIASFELGLATPQMEPCPSKRRTISQAVRRKIAAAQRTRWSNIKQAEAEPAKPSGR